MKRCWVLLAVALLSIVSAQTSNAQPMAEGTNGYSVSDPLFTVGEEINGYTPPGVLDGLGAYKLNRRTVRVLANHELLNFRGYEYPVGGFTLTGARISYFDIDVWSRQIVDSGLAYDTIIDANGNAATDASFQPEPYAAFFGGAPGGGSPMGGFSRFCSSQLVEAGAFNSANWWKRLIRFWFFGRIDTFGSKDRIYFAPEEDGTGFNSVGGAVWALDPETKTIYAVPELGRGGWENITQIDTGSANSVAYILADDSSPYDFNADGTAGSGDGNLEAAPLFLYIGNKQSGGFLERNGLADGQLYVWVADDGSTTPADFNGGGSLSGSWVPVDNSPSGPPSQDGSTGYDEYGYPTQGNLWVQASNLGAFGFSRPEDVATNPWNGREVVMASTGVDSYVGGVDTFGTIYTFKVNFWNLTSKLKIVYDGDADSTRALRSPDNLDWADNGYIFIQEDEAEEATPSGEPLFGAGAVNPNEAGIVRLNPYNGDTLRVANIDRSVVLDASIANPSDAIDRDAGDAGEWESSGILDVSKLFRRRPGTLFLIDVQAHGIADQDDPDEETFNPDSRINDGDLVEGGQLLFLEKSRR